MNDTTNNRYTINHVGMAVRSIDAYLKANAVLYRDFMQDRAISNLEQGVRQVFLSDGKTSIELLEPFDQGSPIWGFLLKNEDGGLIHVCFECDDINAAIVELKASKARVISGPTPDVAFKGRPIAFLFLAGQVIELVQR